MVREVNTQLASVEQIKEFRLLAKELDHEDGELTATQKVKRSAIATRFSDDGRRDVCREQPMTELLEVVVRGLGTGSVYALLALGFVIIYKSTGVISFAQPALMLSGAVVAVYIAPAIGFLLFTGLTFFLSVGMAALATAGVALVVERLRDPADGRATRSSWSRSSRSGSTSRSGSSPRRSSASARAADPQPLGPRADRAVRAAGAGADTWCSIAVLTVVVVVLFWFFRHTRYGLAMRATAFDQEAALTQGVSVGRVFALSWAIAGGSRPSPARSSRPPPGSTASCGSWPWWRCRRSSWAGSTPSRGPSSAGSRSAWCRKSSGRYQRTYAPWLGDNFAVRVAVRADAAGAAGQALRDLRHAEVRRV